MNDLEIDLATQLAEALAEVERLRAELNNAEAAWVAEKDEAERLRAFIKQQGYEDVDYLSAALAKEEV